MAPDIAPADPKDEIIAGLRNELAERSQMWLQAAKVATEQRAIARTAGANMLKILEAAGAPEDCRDIAAFVRGLREERDALFADLHGPIDGVPR